MKRILISITYTFILFFNGVNANTFTEVYAHEIYKSPTNVSLDNLVNHQDSQIVRIIGLNGIFPLDLPNPYPSFDNLLSLPDLKHLTLDTSGWNSYLHIENSRNPQISEEQWNIIKSVPIKTLTLALGRLDNIPLYELNDSQTLKHLTINLPESNKLPSSHLDELFIQLNTLSN